jgi:magnesium transporter
MSGEVAVFAGPNYVLSVRRDSAQGFLGVRARAEREPHLLKHGRRLRAVRADGRRRRPLFPRRRQARIRPRIDRGPHLRRPGRAARQHRAAVRPEAQGAGAAPRGDPLLDAVGRLHGGRVPAVACETQEYFRDVHDHLLRISGRLDTIRDTIATAIQVTLSMVTIEENDINKKLASYAAIFAVFTAFAGIWGMNFEFMPELKWKYGYPFALATMAGVSGYLYRRFKKAGWL